MGIYDDVSDSLRRDTPMRTAVDAGAGVLNRTAQAALDTGRGVVNAGRQAMGDVSFRQRPQALDPRDAETYAAQGVPGPLPSAVSPSPTGQLSTPKTMPTGAVRGVDAPTVSRGVSVVNQYDPDRPASMASGANNPWQDMARQLAAFSQLRSRDAGQGPTAGILEDPNAALNAERTARWDRERMMGSFSGVSGRERARLATQMMMNDANNATQRRGQDISQDTAIAGQGVQARGQDLGYKSHLEGILAQGQARTDAERIQGENQANNTRLSMGLQAQNQAAHDARTGAQALELETAKQKNPYYGSAVQENQAKTGLYKAQTDALLRQADFDKSADASIQRWAKTFMDAGASGPEAMQQAIAAHLASKRAAGGQPSGYADGGPIQVGGRPVYGAGDGKSDSLPAVIDGEHPAALSTGEFVMPVEAVRHFGLDRLNKMVAAARKGLETGRD